MILNQKAGLDMTHVPFAGSPPALTQVMGGQIPMMFDGMATSKAMIQAGKVQAYGVASKTRSPHLPQVPTFAEQGYPDIEFSNWIGLIASARVPAATLDQIHAATVKASASPKVRDRLTSAGFEVGIESSPAQLAASVKTEFERNAAIVKTFDIRLNP
jgi:tripartite-type tricarboxylate transporter receptor subunit TctC